MIHLLDIAYALQQKHDDLYICGSLALYLYGLDLGRTLSDIDLVKSFDNLNLPNPKNENDKGSGNGCDFKYCFTKNGVEYNIRIDPDQKFIYINHCDRLFKVTTIDNIIHYKRDYADKGYTKHSEDLKRLGL